MGAQLREKKGKRKNIYMRQKYSLLALMKTADMYTVRNKMKCSRETIPSNYFMIPYKLVHDFPISVLYHELVRVLQYLGSPATFQFISNSICRNKNVTTSQNIWC